jgi:hypothetical protein
MAISIPQTNERVPRHTAGEINRRLRERTLSDLERFVGAERSVIDARIAELTKEWDIERTLEANAATVAVLGIGLGVLVNRRWLWLPTLVGAFLLQHAIHGWCPPLPVFRRLGVRTAAEIHEEIFALKVLRGDFGRATDAATALEHASLTSGSRAHQ